MKYLIENTSESVISSIETAGGTFAGLGAGESTEVSEAMMKDLTLRFGFLTASPIVEEEVVEEEAEVPVDAEVDEAAPVEEAPIEEPAPVGFIAKAKKALSKKK